MTRWFLLSVYGSLAAALAGGCSTGAQGVDACKKIEEARCRQAPNCPNVSLTTLHSPSGSDVDACIRYYDVDCLHGLAIDTNPSASEVNACVTAINSDGCGVVAEPWIDGPCAWLIPPSVEAGADAADADAAGGADAADGE